MCVSPSPGFILTWEDLICCSTLIEYDLFQANRGIEQLNISQINKSLKCNLYCLKQGMCFPALVCSLS